MYTTRVTRLVRAPRAVIYQALLDPEAVATWRVPAGMRGQVHEFEAREGGTFRMSLMYGGADESAKTSSDRDTYVGRFATLVPDRKVVEVMRFESSESELTTPMTLTTTLSDVVGGTQVEMVHQGVPDGVRPEDNETGMRMALDNLAELVEPDEEL